MRLLTLSLFLTTFLTLGSCTPEPVDREPLLSYQLIGESGSWLVFLHGEFANSTFWSPQTSTLCSTHRCLLIDLRGHGRSWDVPGPYTIDRYAEDVAGLLEAVDIESAVLVGHGHSARTAVETYLKVPGRIRGVIQVDGSKVAAGNAELARTTMLARFNDEGEDLYYDLASGFFPPGTDETLVVQIMQSFISTGKHIGRELLADNYAYDAAQFEDSYAQVQVPLLVLATTTVPIGGSGRRSLIRGEETSVYLQTIQILIPHAEIQTIAGVGHYPQFLATQELNQAIADFVDSLQVL